MISRKIYATGTADTNNAASVQVPSRCRLLGVQWALDADMVTDGASVIAEISLASTNEIAVNQAQQCVSEVRLFNNLATSGMTAVGVNTFFPVDLSLIQGQLVYLHFLVDGTVTFRGGAVLWLSN